MYERAREEAELASWVDKRSDDDLLSISKHLGGCGELNGNRVKDRLHKVVDEKREGLIFVGKEGDIGGLVGRSL